MAGWRPPGRRREGFTLIEVVVALGIVAVVGVATFRLQHQGFRASQRSARLTEAVLLAQQKMAEMQLAPPLAGRGSVQATSGEALHWETNFSPTGREGVSALRVRVRPAPEAPPILELVTYVARK